MPDFWIGALFGAFITLVTLSLIAICIDKREKPAESLHNAWISVKDRLPEKLGFYLVFRDCDGIYIEFFSPAKGFWYDEDADIIGGQTHWMPLPEPPEGGTLG